MIEKYLIWFVMQMVLISNFPYVSQNGEGAEYVNDCGSAVILMVAEYYDVAGDETVDEIHKDMMHGDYPSAYPSLVGYLESEYGLDVEVIASHQMVIIALENLEFDTTGIEVVEKVPFDQPVIWVYSYEAHWVVRYRGWNFDPMNGIWKFSETEDLREIYEPYTGLGIVVVPKGKGEW